MFLNKDPIYPEGITYEDVVQLWDAYDQAKGELDTATNVLSTKEGALNDALVTELLAEAAVATAMVAEAQAAQIALSNKDTLGISKEFHRDIKEYHRDIKEYHGYLIEMTSIRDAAVLAEQEAAEAYREFLAAGKQDANE